MASKYMRFRITAKNGKSYGINAVSEKQAFFLFKDMCITNKIDPTGAKLTDVSGYYPGDMVSIWNTRAQKFIDIVA